MGTVQSSGSVHGEDLCATDECEASAGVGSVLLKVKERMTYAPQKRGLFYELFNVNPSIFYWKFKIFRKFVKPAVFLL